MRTLIKHLKKKSNIEVVLKIGLGDPVSGTVPLNQWLVVELTGAASFTFKHVVTAHCPMPNLLPV